ncbi:MAG: hypothetical protein ACREN2_09710 [Candidatus Dormibacteria bacterium]
MVLVSCGDSSAARFTADASRYLLTIDQLESSDFTVDQAAAPVTATTLAGNDSKTALDLDLYGLAGAASVTYARTIDFATSNGPIEVIDTLSRFATNDGAHSWFALETKHRDGESGEAPVSAGALGDEAHADSNLATTADGLQAVQVSLEWRVANVVVLLQVRGRYGGTRLDDALTLAHRQTSTQLR